MAAVFGMTACYGIKDEDFPELSAITFSEVSNVIDVNIGEELVYTDLKVNSSLPVTYEWSYGQRKQTGTQQDMASINVISDKADIRYTFNRVGTYILRLKADNGEDIQFKYFTLNVNSGMDEGVLVLCDDDVKGTLTFIKQLPENAGADEQEIFPDVFSRGRNSRSLPTCSFPLTRPRRSNTGLCSFPRQMRTAPSSNWSRRLSSITTRQACRKTEAHIVPALQVRVRAVLHIIP